MDTNQIFQNSKKHINRVTVDLYNQPFVNGGFREGEFSGTVDGKKVKFYASISSRLDLNEQKEKLIRELCYALEITESDPKNRYGIIYK